MSRSMAFKLIVHRDRWYQVNPKSKKNATTNQISIKPKLNCIIMPLLSRHKRRDSSRDRSNRDEQEQKQAPLCRSPMFGMRREINLKTCEAGSGAGAGAGANVMSMSMSSNAKNFAMKRSNKSKQKNDDELDEQHKKQPIDSGAINQDKDQELPREISRQQIDYAFALIDTNHDGLIDLRDLSQMLANLGVPIDEAILSYIITTVSRRGDHRMSSGEFVDWLSQFVSVTQAPASGSNTNSSTSSTCTSSPEPMRRVRLGRSRFRLAQPSAGPTLEAIPLGPNNTEPGLVCMGPGRRASVGSGLALMRSLSSEAAAAAAPSTSASTMSTDDQIIDSFAHGISSPQANEQSDELRQDLRAAFCVFDLDGDGYITPDELRAGLKLMGETWTSAEMKRLFERHNQTQSSHRINMDDFCKLLL